MAIVQRIGGLDVVIPTVVADPYTSLLLHCNGVNDGTAFYDSSKYQHAITTVGAAKVSTAQSKFGGASLLLDGSTGNLTFASGADLNFGTGEFTIDFWVRFISDPTSGTKSLLYGSATGDIGLYLNGTQFIVTRHGVASDLTYSPHGMTTNTWYHIAVWRNATNTLRLFINGAYKQSGDAAGKSYLFSNNSYIGAYAGGGRWNGYEDEIRISKGIDRWNDSYFTPPTGPYPYQGEML